MQLWFGGSQVPNGYRFGDHDGDIRDGWPMHAQLALALSEGIDRLESRLLA